MEKNKTKRIFSFVGFFVSLAIFALALSVFILSFTSKSQNRPVELFGYSFAVVVTDSMEPEIKVGDMIIIKSCDIRDIKVGDNAVYIGQSGNFAGKSIVHKVIDVGADENGVWLQTQGIANKLPDPDLVRESFFIGVEKSHSAALGAFISFLRKPLNWLYIIIIIVVLPFAVRQIIYIIKRIRRGKGEEASDGSSDTPEAVADKGASSPDGTFDSTQNGVSDCALNGAQSELTDGAKKADESEADNLKNGENEP